MKHLSSGGKRVLREGVGFSVCWRRQPDVGEERVLQGAPTPGVSSWVAGMGLGA